MELVSDARSLKKYLNSNKNPYFQNSLKSLKLFDQIVEVIKVCEEIGIVHRDLSPSNILILSDESIKIIDFGLCQIDNSQTITLIDEGVGTQNYMAPECESGAEGEITSISDLYSAGKLLWSAISNQNAFAREAPVFDLKSMKSIFPELPGTWHLHHIFEKTIRVDPKNRWENADEALEFCKKVQNLLTGTYQPLELIKTVCPLCGLGNPEPFSMSRMVFSNNPDIQTFQCSYCGYMFSLNYRTGIETLNKRKELD